MIENQNIAIGCIDFVRSNFDSITSKEILKSKGKDIKLFLDGALHRMITEYISARSDEYILSEENDILPAQLPFDCWIIDPLDGSLNFQKGIPYYSVSIAWVRSGEIEGGVVWDIHNDKVYCNFRCDIGEKIIASNSVPLDQAVYATGIPTYLQDESELQDFWRNLAETQLYVKKIRMIGCASLSIINVCNGAFSWYEEKYIAIWDVAAATAIANEMGLMTELRELQFPYYMASIKNVENC